MSNRNSSAGTAAQKSSKCSLIQRPAIILPMLLLYAVFTQAQQRDTVKIIMLISDTSDKKTITTDYHTLIQACDSCMVTYKKNIDFYKDRGTYWLNGFKVIKFIPAGWSPGDVQHGSYWEFESYLDDGKSPINKSWIVWQSMSK